MGEPSNSLRQRRLPWRTIALAAIAAPLLASALARTHFLRVVELKTEDLRYDIRGPAPLHPDLRIVEIDDATIKGLGGHFPLQRNHHGVLAFGLRQAGARSLAFDMIFTGPSSDPYEDRVFSAALQRDASAITLATHYGNDLFVPGTTVARDEPAGAFERASWIPAHGDFDLYAAAAPALPPAALRVEGISLGHANVLAGESPDGSVRHIPLLLQDGEGVMPAFALKAWLRYLGTEASLDATKRALVGADGARLLELPAQAVVEVPYAGGTDRFTEIRTSYLDILTSLRSGAPYSEEELRERFEGTVVLVGLTAPSSLSVDHGTTPYDTASPLLYTHVNLLNALLLGQRVARPASALLLAGAGLLILLSGGLGRRTSLRWWALTSTLATAALLLLAQWAWNLADTMIPVVAPTLALALGNGGLAVFVAMNQERERRILRDTFGTYVSPEILPGILERAGEIELGGSLQKVTVLFLDIRGFTNWNEEVGPTELVGELNEFLSEMVDVVFAHGGAVNKFLGDAILATFGVPFRHADDAPRAVAAAREMRERLRAHNERRHTQGLPPIRIGIGVATGEVLAGNVGSAQRLEYTVIGKPVNLAARLQAQCADDEILIDDDTRAALRHEDYESLGSADLKGFSRAVEIYGLRDRST